jgi:peroxiredoxin
MVLRGSVAILLIALVGCGSTVTEPTLSQVAAIKPKEKLADAAEDKPRPTAKKHDVRKEEVVVVEEAGIPQVFLTSDHSAMCRVRVEDEMPAIKLPKLGGGEADLASLKGKKATVVLFWHNDLWMSETALEDLARDVSVSEDAAVIGVAVKTSEADVVAMTNAARATFTQLLDNDGKAFGKVGMTKLPRVYVLDGSGKIVWFDIEYSQSTRRELQRTLAELANQ